MDYQCKNCKNRATWECEDYHWGYYDTERCKDDFQLDFNTLSEDEKYAMMKLAEAIRLQAEREDW